MHQAARHIPAAVLTLCLLWLAVPATAQDNDFRAPVQQHIPMQIIENEPAPDKPEPPAAMPAQPAAKPAQPKAAPAQPEAQPHGKFLNRDTAKNRQDYEMGTDSGADSIRLGRDEDTGDTVMSHTPPKRQPQADPFENQPIQVRPVIPMRR